MSGVLVFDTGPFDADWIRVDDSDDIELLVVQARYTSRLVSGRNNLGECGVLALAEVRGHTAVLDDRVARQVGEDHGVQITGTLALMSRASGKDYASWAREQGLV